MSWCSDVSYTSVTPTLSSNNDGDGGDDGSNILLFVNLCKTVDHHSRIKPFTFISSIFKISYHEINLVFFLMIIFGIWL